MPHSPPRMWYLFFVCFLSLSRRAVNGSCALCSGSNCHKMWCRPLSEVCQQPRLAASRGQWSSVLGHPLGKSKWHCVPRDVWQPLVTHLAYGYWLEQPEPVVQPPLLACCNLLTGSGWGREASHAFLPDFWGSPLNAPMARCFVNGMDCLLHCLCSPNVFNGQPKPVAQPRLI